MESRNWTDVEISVAEQAAEWMLTLKDPDTTRSEREAFVSWLRRSPVHVEEFLRVSSLDAELVGRNLGVDVEALIAACGNSTAVELLRPARAPYEPSFEGKCPQARAFDEHVAAKAFAKRGQNRWWLALAASVGAVAVIGAIAWIIPSQQSIYTTERGEQRSISLPDNSRVDLNTETRLQVAYSKGLRKIVLLEGEALFSVAKSPHRPFIVYAGGHSIRATGTRFSVSERSARTIVAVLEGSVAVRETAKSEQNNVASVQLSAGQQLIASSPSPQVQPIDPDRATAWQQWKLYFNNETLASIVAEFNRYNRQQLSIADPALAQRRITGVFFANQPDSLLAFIANRDSVEISEDRDGSKTIKLKEVREGLHLPHRPSK